MGFPSIPAADVPFVSTREAGALVAVTFRVPARVGGRHAELIAEFVDWAPIPMDRAPDGGFALRVAIEPGRWWRYCFIVDTMRVIVDPDASEYLDGPGGSHMSAVRV